MKEKFNLFHHSSAKVTSYRRYRGFSIPHEIEYPPRILLRHYCVNQRVFRGIRKQHSREERSRGILFVVVVAVAMVAVTMTMIMVGRVIMVVDMVMSVTVIVLVTVGMKSFFRGRVRRHRCGIRQGAHRALPPRCRLCGPPIHCV